MTLTPSAMFPLPAAVLGAGGMLDDLLELVCQDLQISFTMHEEAKGHYEAIGNWLSAPASPFFFLDPIIFPQGSFQIRTTTRPPRRNEYDLDMVCELKALAGMTPLGLLAQLEARLASNDLYSGKLDRLKRCVRVSYANKFHLDILPAVPDVSRSGTCPLVPDRNLCAWKPSNPRGYATWFEDRARPRAIAKAHMEFLPAHQTHDEKNPLQHAVQLMKRSRDLYFADDPEAAPRSIVLTTMAATYYQGQASPAEALSAILREMLAAVSAQQAIVRNPMNPAEELSEQWSSNPETYLAFLRWLSWFAQKWFLLFGARGLAAAERTLSELFSEDVVKKALSSYDEKINVLRKGSGLGVSSSGTLTTTGAVARHRPNTYFGG